MLKFFRKYQRLFFFATTFAVVVSFCFFGTYKTMMRQGTIAQEDQELGKGAAGKAIKAREFSALCHLIESSTLDRSARERMPNLFNPGVIEKEFLASGLAVMLVKPYFATMKKDLDERVKRIHVFHPFAHAHSSQISVEGVWDMFSAPMMEHYRLLKERSDQATLESFGLMCQLYVEQIALPPASTLRQVLMMQQNQMDVEPDPILEQADLSMFGFKSLDEWFGPQFVPLVASFILNTAQMAEEKGYDVTMEEVRTDLLQNIYQGHQRLVRQGELSPEEVNQYYVTKMRGMGLDEKSLLGAWKQVLLFRRLFDDASSSVLIDPLVYQQFEQFAKESVEVDLYQLPASLQFTDFLSMLKFQLYVEGIAGEGSALRKNGLLPTTVATVQQIEKKAPQLVENELKLEWRTVTKEALESGVSTKETLTWELIDEHWALLKKTFAFLNDETVQTLSQRIARLNSLSEEQRLQVDVFARSKVVTNNPDLVIQALLAAPLQTTTFGLRPGANFQSVFGVEETPEFLSLLKTAALRGQEPNESSRRLQLYSVDQNHFFSVEVLSRQEEKKVLTFAQAMQDGTLDRQLTHLFEKEYPELRKKHPIDFQTAAGGWKPLEMVKEQVGKYFFADLLKAIEDSYVAKGGMLPQEAPSLSFYSDARFFALMAEAKERLQVSQETIASLSSSLCDNPLALQWLLRKEAKVLTRSVQADFSQEEMFSLEPKEWTPVQIGKRGALTFCFVKGKAEVGGLPLDSTRHGHQILAQDAKRDLMGQLLQYIHKEKSVDLLSYKVAEEPR